MRTLAYATGLPTPRRALEIAGERADAHACALKAHAAQWRTRDERESDESAQGERKRSARTHADEKRTHEHDDTSERDGDTRERHVDERDSDEHEQHVMSASGDRTHANTSDASVNTSHSRTHGTDQTVR